MKASFPATRPWAAFRLGLTLGLLLAAAAAPAAEAVRSVQWQKGRVMVRRDAGLSATTNAVELPGAIRVMTNGTFTVQGGKVRRLAEGQILDAEGNLTSPDGTIGPVANHVVLRQGRVLLVQDGEGKPLAGEIVLGDGRHLKPDGTLRTPQGTLQRMLDGQLFKLDGHTIASTDTASLQKGVVVLQKDGSRFPLRRDQKMAMSDGTQVFGDGRIILPNGTQKRLAEGEIFKIPGVKGGSKG
ncbi:MAG: hypothetical protein RJA22_425 [Verrucomicrobiota bacterium]